MQSDLSSQLLLSFVGSTFPRRMGFQILVDKFGESEKIRQREARDK